MAEQNPVIMDIATTMYRANAGQHTRNLPNVREMGERTYNTLTSLLDEKTQQLAEQDAEIKFIS